MRCSVCIGSGRVMGGGMIYHDCFNCDGAGSVDIDDDFSIDKGTDSYQRAKSNIKKLDENMTDEEAEQILDQELEKLNEEENAKPKAKKKLRRKRRS